MDERQCKIRVVERLSEFHHAIWTTASPAELLGVPNGSSFLPRPADFKLEQAVDGAGPLASAVSEDSSGAQPSLAAHDELASADSTTTSLLGLDDSTIETLSDQDLEQLSEKLLERVVRQLVTVAHTSEELLEELNSLDEAGLSLLHYVSFYNYSTLVPLLLSHGAQINQQSTQGQSALHLAAGCGHKEVVDVLVQSGADMFALDFDGFTAADRADKSEHGDVATLLRRLMGSQDAEVNRERRIAREGSPFHAAATDDFSMEIDFGGENFETTMEDSGDGMIEFGSQPSNCDSPGEPSGGGKSKNYVRELDDAVLSCSCVSLTTFFYGVGRRKSRAQSETASRCLLHDELARQVCFVAEYLERFEYEWQQATWEQHWRRQLSGFKWWRWRHCHPWFAHHVARSRQRLWFRLRGD